MNFSEYSPAWIQEFEQTKSSLLMGTEGWLAQVEHYGSTALPGCIAVPVIDVLAGLSDMTGLNEATAMIEGLNFRRLPAPTWCDEELVAFLQKPRGGTPTHSILLVAHQKGIWRQCLSIRERLLTDWNCRDNLINLKRDHCSGDAENRMGIYETAKSDFFSAIVNDL